jgi:imidazolonepropionase-like amidohydrolase
VLVHTTQAEKVDEEFLALLREKKPYWTTVIGLGDRSEVCDHDPFIERTYPDRVLTAIRESSACGPGPANAAAREEILAYNITRMIANGARLVLGTDAGITPRHAFGWADHHELGRWVRSGVSPAEAIVAATSRPARLLGLSDAGVLEAGARADFIVLSANPLDDIGNTRAIVTVFLNGAALDRDAMAARWKH